MSASKEAKAKQMKINTYYSNNDSDDDDLNAGFGEQNDHAADEPSDNEGGGGGANSGGEGDSVALRERKHKLQKRESAARWRKKRKLESEQQQQQPENQQQLPEGQQQQPQPQPQSQQLPSSSTPSATPNKGPSARNVTIPTAERPFQCIQCGNCYTSVLSMRKHQDMVHGHTLSRCNDCHQEFQTARLCRFHRCPALHGEPIPNALDQADTEMVDAQTILNLTEIRTASIEETVTSTATSTSAASSSNSSSSSKREHEMLVRPIAISFDTVMADLCMSIMFSYLNQFERCDCSAVSRSWYHSVRHPSTWYDQYLTHTQAECAPSWLRACINKVNYDYELRPSIGEMTHLKRLRIGEINENSKTMTLREIRSALCQLKKLEELVLYQIQAPDIWAALFQRDESASSDTCMSVAKGIENGENGDPAVWTWESTLKSIWISNSTRNLAHPAPAFGPMFDSLSQRVWHQLDSFTWNFGEEQSPDIMTSFQHFLASASSSIPSLTHLQLHFLDHVRAHRSSFHSLVGTLKKLGEADLPKLTSFNGRFLSRNQILLLPTLINWPSLTAIDIDVATPSSRLERLVKMKKLKIDRIFLGRTLSFFQAIGHHTMPDLVSAVIPLSMIHETHTGVSEADSQVIRCIMSEMKSLTHLQAQFEVSEKVHQFAWIHHLDALPSLTHLEFNCTGNRSDLLPIDSLLPRAVGALKSLTRFYLATHDILLISQLRELTSVWAGRASTCVISEVQFFLTLAANYTDEQAFCEVVKNLAQLPHLTELRIIRPLSIIPRRAVSDEDRLASYLPHLCLLRHLKLLVVDDSHYMITPAVLNEWTRDRRDHRVSTSDMSMNTDTVIPFETLKMLRICYDETTSSASETVRLLDKLPALEELYLFGRRVESTPESELFLRELKECIKQRNESGRRPRIAFGIWLGRSVAF